ncbi:MAG TPA: APC family permease [Bdellovibrionota bacterium]|jgi:APA family basic amino acid/polyamine antiporter|nr:APC family permease [Bdellovibrionota bacterium]
MRELLRGLGLWDATALVAGTVIGTGIFLKTTVMAQEAGSPGWVMAAWIAAGVLSVMGALVYAEVGARFPEAGGEYAYLREGYGDMPAFLCGWTRFWIGSPGSIAAYAAGTAAFFQDGLWNPAGFPGGPKGFALFLVAIFSGLNCLAVTVSGRLATVLTAAKVVLILGLSLGVFFGAPTATWFHVQAAQLGASFPGWSAFGAATLAALWAFDGWNGMPMMAGEIREPRRNVPLGLFLGIGVVLAAYLLANAAYFYALPFKDILGANSSDHPDAPSVGALAAMTFLGPAGRTVLSAAFAISALGAMSATILAGARVPYAMARDGLAPKWLGHLSSTGHVPVQAVAVQGLVAGVLVLSGTFDQLTDYVVFASWIFYGAVAGSVFVFRKRGKAPQGAYRAPLYPLLPLAFLALAALLLSATLVTNPKGSGVGLLMIAAGIPAYLWFGRTARRPRSR